MNKPIRGLDFAALTSVTLLLGSIALFALKEYLVEAAGAMIVVYNAIILTASNFEASYHTLTRLALFLNLTTALSAAFITLLFYLCY